MQQLATVPLRAASAAPGFSLVVVLVLLGAIALGSVAALRGSAGSTQLARAQLMRAMAQEQAQAGLLYCEAQVLLPSAARLPALAQGAIPSSTPTQPAWASAALWRSGTALVAVPWAEAASGGKSPVCLVEAQNLPEQGPGVTVYTVNARGFSPDHRADATSGVTVAGVAVWLQSTLLIENAQVRARLWRRMLNPPLR
ncbi:MAG: hypothetical protein WCK08_11070 [Betaproteobacteria bacterium]